MWLSKQISKAPSEIKSRSGFELAYRTYWKELFGICYYQLQDEEQSKEVIQNVFKSLLERREKVVIKNSLKGYLIRAVKLEIMDYFRTEASHSKHMKGYALEQTNLASATGWETEFQELNGKLSKLVNGLPVQRQRVFKMSRYDGLKNHEIASQLDISTKAVEYHISKALGHLRSELQEYRAG